MHKWRPYFWRTFVKDWSIHWWFAKLCRITSQKPLLLWPIYWKCKAGPPGHCSQSWQTCAGNRQAGFGFPAVGKQFQERVWITLEQRAMSVIERWVLSTTVSYCESQSRGKHCPREVKHIAASLKSLKNRIGTERLFIREPALDREQSEPYSAKVHWRSFYRVQTN